MSILLVVFAAVLWGTLPVFVRQMTEFSTWELIFIRCFTAAVLLGIYALFVNREMFKIRLKHLWCFLGTGIVSLLFFNFCYYKAINYTSMSVAAVLLYTAPCFVMILSALLFKERITVKKLAAMLIAFMGCVCISGVIGGETQLGVYGLLLGLGSGFGYALYSIFSRFALNRGYHSMTISFYTFVFAAVGTIPWVRGGYVVQTMAGHPLILLAAAGFGLSTVLAYICYTSGLKHIDNSQASIIACIEPAVATLIGFIFYHELLDLFMWLGLILVLGSTILVNIGKKESNK